MSNLKILSLFTGIGAFEYALSLLNNSIDFEVVGYSEIDKFAIETYEKNFPGVKNYGDIRKIDTSLIPQYDILVGGSPCQDFSINGKRKGVEGDRGSLIFEYIRILKDTKPKYFIFENVKGLISQNGGKDFELLKKEFENAGYNIVYQVLNSKNFGLPQNRERVFIIGMRKDLGEFIFKIPTSNGKTSIIKDILDDEFDHKYYRSEERIKGLYNSKFQSERGEHIEKVCHCLMASGTKKWIVENRDVDFINRFNKRQLDIKELNGIKVRQLTPQEYEKIQGFPINFTSGISDSQRYKQLGNSISINVLESIFKEFFTYLTKKEEKIKNINKNRVHNSKKVLNPQYDEVVEALYVINKHTKKIRDDKLDIIDIIYNRNYYIEREEIIDMHEYLHNLKYEIETMYNIKSKTIKKLHQKGILNLEGYHTFDDGYARDYYTFGIYKFHNNTNNSKINLGHISGIISQEKELSKMSHIRALEILREFLKYQELEKVTI